MKSKSTHITFIFFFAALLAGIAANAQIKMGSNPQTIGASSLLELESTSKALVISRMTTAQLAALATPVAGMMVYNTDSNCIAQRTSSAWKYLCATGGNSSPSSWQVTGNSGTNSGSNFLGTTNNTSLIIKTNNTQRMIIDSTGKVGIGITNPTNKLEVNGSVRLDGQLKLLYPSTSNDARIWLDQNGEFLIDQNTTNQPMVFRTNTATLEKMRIQWNGNVGIGTTTPATKLEVNGAIRTVPVVLTAGTTVSTDASLGNYLTLTAEQNFTLANPTNGADGQRIMWKIKQDGTGSRLITLGNNFRMGTDIPTVTLSITANKSDYIGAVYNSADGKWDIVAFVKGY